MAARGEGGCSGSVLIRSKEFLGRARELARVSNLLQSAEDGRGGALLISGEAGIGKTALVDQVLASRSGFASVRVSGVQGEMELPFATLQQVCAPFLGLRGRLPDPQRQALEVALGLCAGDPADRFLVGLGALGVLSEAGGGGPLVGVVDDAQWMDQASAQALSFVGRRLFADRVALLFTAREVTKELSGLPELALEGLSEADSRELLTSAIHGPVDQRVRERIVIETHGNPLALLELPRSAGPSELAGGFALPPVRRLSRRIEAGFERRLRALPENTQCLVTIAAADPVGDPALLWGAAVRLGIEPSAASAAEADGLLRIAERVAFRHPLVRSAVYGSASIAERQRVHRVLGEATDPSRDPDRRAWHLAHATQGHDETLAAELERSAGRAQARGGYAAAAAFLERAVSLTPGCEDRTRRSLAAARAKCQAGAFDAATRMLDEVEREPLGALARAEVVLLRGQVVFALNYGRDAPPVLRQAAQLLEPLNPSSARETLLDALAAALLAGRLAGEVGAAEVARVARVAVSARHSTATDLLLDGLALLIVDGYPAGTPVLQRAVAEFVAGRVEPEHELRWSWLAGHAAGLMWDFSSWNVLAHRFVEMARSTGAMSLYPIALSTRAGTHLFAGELASAEAVADEVETVMDATHSTIAPYAALGFLAFEGRDQAAESRYTRAAEEDAERRGEGVALTFLEWAGALFRNSIGSYRSALSSAMRAAEDAPAQRFRNWALVELIEAAVRCGETARGAAALERLRETTRPTATDWGLGVEARCTALLSSGEQAARQYQEAIERLQRTEVHADLARAHLLYGEWLRREGRRVQAREHLRGAQERFERFGMHGFAERATVELRATGERARRRVAETRDDLTPQELQISRLAADGATNAEIASRMFISASTVDYHLRKVFRKLGLRSRTQLARHLLEIGEAHAQAPD